MVSKKILDPSDLHGRTKKKKKKCLFITTNSFWNAMAVRDLCAMSAGEVVNTAGEKLPSEENFSNLLEQEKSQLQFSEQVIYSVQHLMSFLHPLFSILKPRPFVKWIGHGISGQSKQIWLIYGLRDELQRHHCSWSVFGPWQLTRRAIVKCPKRTRETINSKNNTWKVCRIIAQHYTCRERSVLLLWFV